MPGEFAFAAECEDDLEVVGRESQRLSHAFAHGLRDESGELEQINQQRSIFAQIEIRAGSGWGCGNLGGHSALIAMCCADSKRLAAGGRPLRTIRAARACQGQISMPY